MCTRVRPGTGQGMSPVLWSCPSRRRPQRESSREGGEECRDGRGEGIEIQINIWIERERAQER